LLGRGKEEGMISRRHHPKLGSLTKEIDGIIVNRQKYPLEPRRREAPKWTLAKVLHD